MRPLPPPRWNNGVLLSAADMNRLSEIQYYIRDTSARVNIAYRYVSSGETCYIYHYHDWLYWSNQAPEASTLMINGVAGPSASSATWGWVNLDTDGANPYNVTWGRPYTLQWQGGNVLCNRLFEAKEYGAWINYPNPVPTFGVGNILQASDLNNISANLEYVMQADSLAPYMGYARVLGDVITSYKRYYHGIRHRNRYLYIACTIHPDTSMDRDAKLHVYWNYEDDANVLYDGTYHSGQGDRNFRILIDMQGNNHIEYGGYGVFPSPGPSFSLNVGDFYNIVIRARAEEQSGNVLDDTWINLDLVCEVPIQMNLLP